MATGTAEPAKRNGNSTQDKLAWVVFFVSAVGFSASPGWPRPHVGLEATLGEARDAMLAVKGAQDVFVTKSGQRTERVECCLTNVAITRAATLN